MSIAGSKKRTIVRIHDAGCRAGFAAAEKCAPALGGRYAARRWLTVPAAPAAPAEPAGGEEFAVRVGDGAVRGTSYGTGPVVYLMHGWGGSGAQLSVFVKPLRQAGFRVVRFDAPSHGRSDPGACGRGRTHGVEFAAALAAVMRRFGPADTVIAHSMGVLPSLLVQRSGLPVGRLALIAPVQDLDGHLDRFAALVGMGPRTRRAMNDRIAGLIGEPVVGMDVRRLAEYAGSIPLLVVHDRGDRETWYAHSVELTERWSGPVTLITTEGLGHRRIVADAVVVDQVADFVGLAADRSARSEWTAA
ncbi:alpha/beta hydrolase [Nakamurella sp.]|uniref:alpha/beta hydrolase n=1 Tax=Nakamurella sp. TaxID=1869182 RepID=UPI003784B0A5